MNNQIPFFNPFNNLSPRPNPNEYERLEDKIERLEKRIRILENRVNKLENTESYNSSKHDYLNNEPTDMYMI